MLYDSTKSLLQTILRALETGDENQWDDQAESANACLYEMHQMSRSLYRPYKPDKLNAASSSQSNQSEKLTRAIPHARMMVIAIRHKDQAKAIDSGRAALAAMNGTVVSARPTEPAAEAAVAPKANGKPRLSAKSAQGFAVGI